MTTFALIALLPALLLAIGIFRCLSHAGFRRSDAVLLTLLSLAQAGTAMALAQPGVTLWLATGVGALAASAAAFAEREDLRRVILLGGALAAIQFCDPSGAVVAAGMLPATFALGAPRAFQKAAGFYVSLLFVPLCAAALLLYLAREGYMVIIPAGAGHVHGPASPVRLLLALAPAMVAAPALYPTRKTSAGRAVGLVAGAVVFAAGFAALAGAARRPETMLSAAAPLSALAIAALPPSPCRMRQAYAAALAGLALSWAALALASV